jgi:hypothetical protein
MLPIKTSSIFKSRWMALLWAAGIMWTAYDFAGTKDQGVNSTDVDVNMAQVAAVLK